MKKFMFCGQVLEEIKNEPYLEPYLDCNMKCQLIYLALPDRQRSYCMLRGVKEAAFKSLGRPKLECASTAWDPYYIFSFRKLRSASVS